MMMQAPEKRRGVKEIARVFLILLVASGSSARSGDAGDAPGTTAVAHGRLMALSIRIAQAEGNERRIRRYKSLARQHRAGKGAPAPRQSSRKTRFAPW